MAGGFPSASSTSFSEMIFKRPSTNPAGSAAMLTTPDNMQTAMRYLRNEDMNATNRNLALERLECATASRVHLEQRPHCFDDQARALARPTELFLTANPSRSGEACTTSEWAG